MPLLVRVRRRARAACATALLLLAGPACTAQHLLRTRSPDRAWTSRHGDEAVLDSQEARRDLPCIVKPKKPELSFDLRFQTGYTVKLKLDGMQRSENVLTMVFRVSGSRVNGATYMRDDLRVPAATEQRAGEVVFEGAFDIGEGDYHVDWMMRDRSQTVCSAHWDISARLSQKQSMVRLQIPPGQVMPSIEDAETFSALGAPARRETAAGRVSIIANLGSSGYGDGGAIPADVHAIASALKTIVGEPRIGNIALTVVDIVGQRILYRNDGSGDIDWLSIRHSLKPGNTLTVDAKKLAEMNGEAEFLTNLALRELGAHPQALIFISPTLASELKMPRQTRERFAVEACPVFYLSIDADPAKDPWRDL